MDRSPITNRWGEAETTRVDAEHIPVYRGGVGTAYNHHHQIVSLDGTLVASWSNGIAHEDDPGQRMLMATSEDLGATWSEARPVADRRPGAHADAIITAMGIREYQQRLYAYYGVYEYPPEGLVKGASPAQRPSIGKALWPEGEFWSFDECCEIVESTDGGATWSQPVGSIDGCVPNLRPEAVAGGRLILPGNIMFPFTDDPAGVSGWKRVGIPGLPEDYRDAPGRFQKEFQRRGESLNFCEGSFFQTDDGVIHMMLRSDSDVGLLGVTESSDNGETWSEPILTGYTDSRCRFHFGRLPDGRFFGLSCPKPKSGRTPLVLATSDDGVSFDRHYILGDSPPGRSRLPGHHKGGTYGYPSYHIMGDTVYVIYSIQKEDIAVCRFGLDQLSR